ncbi:GNAT family N-acetyltransferase [Demequina sp. TTPB684]|uniref:GNAT family N-acetyltransferase n=1 Tax=unclassified Demequina TaxID=2620311 RepID=UPI001CF5665C|nr:MULTISPECIES: GNAT family N-acetyltransferase [unclassified Demequina]MCB2412572.1 GNAT family N-acetyltransferase [Demequina sp. TTPB684]UPU87552.1 GNAT family N-acetyltransferase [Demequina sp. TMPB413]
MQNLAMRIEIESPYAPDIVALLEEHLADMHLTSPPESVHALDVARLAARHVTFVAARRPDGALLGVGALAALGEAHSEIKSMRTTPAARGRGVAAAVLTRLLDIAKERGDIRVSLETGSQEFFSPAHRLYERHAFAECEPFGSYVRDPHSRFFTLDLTHRA